MRVEDENEGYASDSSAEEDIFNRLIGNGGGDDGDEPTDDDEGDEPTGDDEDEGDEGDEDEGDEGDEDEGDEGDNAQAEVVDYEFNGQKYKVPKPVLEGITGAQEELDNMRKYVAAQQRQVQHDNEMFEGLAPYILQVQNIDSQIEQLRSQRPDPASDPIGYMTFGKQVEELQDARQRLSAQLAKARTELTEKRQSAKAELVASGKAILAKHIPGWDGKKAGDVAQHMRSLGYAPAELEELSDPRAVIMAYESYMYRQMKAGIGKAKEKRASAPPPVVRAKGQAPQGNARDAQYKKAVARAKKTGSMRDAENALLAALTRPKPKKRG